MKTPTSPNINESSKSIALDLERLTKKYQTLLIEYQQAVVNYVNYIKVEPISIDTSTNELFVTVKGSSYWGTSGISQNNSNTLNKCMTSCKNTLGCTGATFNSTDNTKSTCFLRKGSSTVSVGKEGDYAIINKGQYLLSIVEGLNKQLTKINDQIVEKTREGKTLYNSLVTDSISQNEILINKYIDLNKDRVKIAEMMNEYQTLDESQDQGVIKIDQNYYSFVLLLVVAILIIYIYYSFASSSNPIMQSGGTKHFPYYILLVVFLLSILLFINSKMFSNFIRSCNCHK